MAEKFQFLEASNRFHRVVWQMVAYLAATHHDMFAEAKGKGEYGVVLEGNTIDFGVRIILNDVLSEFRKRRVGRIIQWGAVAKPHPGAKSNYFDWGQSELNHSVFCGIFAMAFDPFTQWMVSEKRTDYHQWPPVMNFCRVVRNAIAHSGKFKFKGERSPVVSWRGLTVDNSFDGQLLGSYITTGDIIVLMSDLNTELAGQGAPVSIDWQSVEYNEGANRWEWDYPDPPRNFLPPLSS